MKYVIAAVGHEGRNGHAFVIIVHKKKGVAGVIRYEVICYDPNLVDDRDTYKPYKITREIAKQLNCTMITQWHGQQYGDYVQKKAEENCVMRSYRFIADFLCDDVAYLDHLLHRKNHVKPFYYDAAAILVGAVYYCGKAFQQVRNIKYVNRTLCSPLT